MRIFDNLRLGVKLGLLVLVVIVGVVAAGFAVSDLVQKEMLSSRIEELRAFTESAKSLAGSLQKQVESGELTRDAAQLTFSRILRSMTYDGGQGYIFAYRMDGTTVATPDPKQTGVNRLDVLINGRMVIREIRDAVQARGEAIIRYDYPRAGETRPAPKVSYATALPMWGMFIGTGSYIDDLDARFRPLAWTLIGGGFLLAIVIAGIAWFIARRITRPLAGLEGCMRQLAAGVLDVEISGHGRKDEVGSMAATVQVFRDNARRGRLLEREQEEARSRRALEDERVRIAAEQAAAGAAATLVVGSIGTGLEQLASGDLTFRLNAALPGAYEKLRVDFNHAADKLRDTMVVVADNTGAIRSGSDEIASAATDLSRRTEQQAASLEETAAALDQITATVRTTAEAAMRASLTVAKSKGDAEQSGEIVVKAVKAMQNLEQSATQISQIIGVIDEIAFQTNLLALNAGVEAARAGDSGRGFAVVASEVRALAQRSADAAKEIKSLISGSTQQVARGGQTRECGGAFAGADRIPDNGARGGGIGHGERRARASERTEGGQCRHQPHGPRHATKCGDGRAIHCCVPGACPTERALAGSGRPIPFRSGRSFRTGYGQDAIISVGKALRRLRSSLLGRPALIRPRIKQLFRRGRNRPQPNSFSGPPKPCMRIAH
jgi:methyl-accepting chemotaxis protein